MTSAVSPDLWPEMMGAGARQLLTPLRVWWRQSPLYRHRLKGQLADHLAFQPHDPCPARLEDAEALLRGRFRFHGRAVDVQGGVSALTLHSHPPRPRRSSLGASFHRPSRLAAIGRGHP